MVTLGGWVFLMSEVPLYAHDLFLLRHSLGRGAYMAAVVVAMKI